MNEVTPLRRVEPVKVCAKCGEKKPWSQFGARARWEDGSIRWPRSSCKTCEARRTRERMRNDPAARQRKREIDRRWRARRIATDPGFRRAEAKRTAEYRYARGARPSGPAAVEREDSGYVPLAPFRVWLEDFIARECEGNHCEAAMRLGTADRTLRAWLRERDLIRVDTLDAALCEVGDPWLLAELYPDLYDDRIAA